LEAALLERAQAAAAQFGLGLQVEWLGRCNPAPMSERVQMMLAESADFLALKRISLGSGAGHDAQSLAKVCPVGMIFIPSVEGASHSPREFSRWRDCVNGANLLLQAALRMASDF